MSEFEKTLKELTEDHLYALVSEIYEYFKMLPNIYDEKVKARLNIYRGTVLKQHSLTTEKLNDPFNIPEIINLASYIVNNNRDFFSSDWNTRSYYHHDRNQVIINLMKILEPFAERINKIRHEKLDKLIEELETKSSESILSEEDKFINISFSDYELPHYDSYVDLINKSIHFDNFYKLLPFLLRCLFENLLYDLLHTSLHKRHTELFFLESQNRARDFSQLISLLNFLKDKEFRPKIKEKVTPIIIQILNEIKEIGNYTVHDVIERITKESTQELKNKSELAIKTLLVCYKHLKDQNIEIDDENRENKIKMDLGLTRKEKKKVGSEPLKINKKPSELNEEKKKIVKFYNMLSHNIEFSKGELTALTREIGNNNFNKYLNLEMREKTNIIEIINDRWNIIILNPIDPKSYNYMIHNLKLKENNQYRDNPEDPGNVKIYYELMSFLEKQPIIKDKK